ncbi:MAG: hypothetical protein IT159_12295 [Bryobacterales bacterium]|nr:hypothetical protein [Bryobacterales bacterium]
MKKKESATSPVQCLCMGLGPKVTEMLQCRSDAAAGHLRNARVEFLKALRVLIDERIAQLTTAQKKRGTAVPVE